MTTWFDQQMRIVLVGLLAGCGWLPSDSPAAPKPPPPDPDVAAIAHVWKVDGHVLGTRTTISDQDAIALHGRTVNLTGNSYTTPWQGTCDEARRTKAATTLVEVTADVDVSPDGRARLEDFGLAKNLTELTLTCIVMKAPPLTVWLSGDRAMTCFGGVCYLMSR